MSEWGSGLRMHLASPGFSAGADFRAEASDQAIFAKFAKPLGHGLALGGLFGWERSALSATNIDGAGNLTYTTRVSPTNHCDSSCSACARCWLSSWEFRAGVAVRPFRGTIIDTGYVGLWRSSAVDHSSSLTHEIADSDAQG